MSTERLTVHFCCNDDHGNPQLVVEQIEVGELILLEGPAWFDEDLAELVGTTLIRWTNIGLWIGGRWFRHHGRGRYVGNIHWDAAVMDRAEVARLLAYMRTLEGWSWVEAETSLAEAWAKGEITVEALERAIES